MEFAPLDIICFSWFFLCWLGYTVFSRQAAKKTNCLSSVLFGYRKEWVEKLSRFGMSEVDGELLASLEKQVSFFASTSLLILASLVTVLSAAADQLMNIATIIDGSEVTLQAVQAKLMLLIVIFTYAFFSFTWSIRQYGFCFILFGSSFQTVKYYKEADDFRAVTKDRNFEAVTKVLDRAAHSYNYGLRAYYFALAALAWFINAYASMLVCAVIVFVLYRREFKSASLEALVTSRSNIAATSRNDGAAS
jgi:uncharacterized membrane protein